MNEKTQAEWDACSDEYFDGEDHATDIEEIKKSPQRAFPREVWAMLQEAFPDLTGKKVLVPSCGNSFAVYAFHLLGADVTASDLSSQQLKNAKRYANAQGWDTIPFIQADSMTLEGIPDNTFDLIHTSNGAHVWIGDLAMMYGNFNRVLKPGGSFIFFETHPFHRPFGDTGFKGFKRVIVKKPYTDTCGGEIEYHWRIQDFMQALLGSGFSIEDFQELMPHEDDLSGHMWHYDSYKERDTDKFARYDWRKNPMAALPAWLAVRAANTKKQQVPCGDAPPCVSS
ncbi:MAG: methyltransferase domain-containing protein [Firmicutes bacterium]|nr:methyltransferase domain-containing protein [Bacillota bacterium]